MSLDCSFHSTCYVWIDFVTHGKQLNIIYQHLSTYTGETLHIGADSPNDT